MNVNFLEIAIPAFCRGALITLEMSAISLLLGLAVGIPWPLPESMAVRYCAISAWPIRN